MEIRLKLSTGKEIDLTMEELKEIMKMSEGEPITIYPTYPYYPQYSYTTSSAEV